ncbi:Sbal_3080 family lipoprotein [Vibrio sp. MarTm2]|uniref:Sbal_3080 family lipoprotein n=1 Tax=Vibrio sp. MarTm2 TaxID=2998831 RepID=UPI0022CDA1A0|nr:Sbal_3080 family lipoprotein [Vibrio sp. MarTm2]MDA0128218.1 Sbal_3080 family lipoprotein [Vibrio sp. MarTm2]
MFKKLTIVAIPFLLAACAAPKYTVDPIPQDKQSKEITIVRDDATRDIFLQSMQEWCLDNAHRCKVVNDGTPPEAPELTLTYISRWSWDFSTFIADANIKAYKNDQKVGNVEFKAANNSNPDKWGDDRKRIMAMMDLLFSLSTPEEAQAKIKSGEM